MEVDLSDMDLAAILNGTQLQAPAIMGGAGMAPALAGGQVAADADVVLAALQLMLHQQQQRYGNGEQPPVRVQQQQQYNGPPLRYLMTGRAVKFCTTREEVLHHYQTLPEGRYWPVPEYAARLQGANNAGIVRTRVNTTGHAPSAIPVELADRLGLRRHPLRAGGGVVSTILYQDTPAPAEVLEEPLTVQLLAGPGAVALEITLPAVLVLPGTPGSDRQLFELQLGLFDFCAAVEMDFIPLWASQFKVRESGYCFALPVVAPPPPHIYGSMPMGSSTFHITQAAYDEVLEITLARQAVLARRTAAAAAAAAAGAEEAASPAEAAAEAMLQSRRVQAGPTAAEAAETAAAAAAVGTREWIDEWTTAPRPQQQRQQQRGRRGGRRGRGRGRGSSSSSRQQAAQASSGAAGPAAAVTADSAAAAEAHAAAATAATTTAGVYAGLDPLPAGLTASLWRDVAATSLPEGDECCIICMDGFEDDLEDGSTRLVTQLACRHTHCVLCLRQYVTQRSFRRQPLRCPHCNTQV